MSQTISNKCQSQFALSTAQIHDSCMVQLSFPLVGLSFPLPSRVSDAFGSLEAASERLQRQTSSLRQLLAQLHREASNVASDAKGRNKWELKRDAYGESKANAHHSTKHSARDSFSKTHAATMQTISSLQQWLNQISVTLQSGHGITKQPDVQRRALSSHQQPRVGRASKSLASEKPTSRKSSPKKLVDRDPYYAPRSTSTSKPNSPSNPRRNRNDSPSHSARSTHSRSLQQSPRTKNSAPPSPSQPKRPPRTSLSYHISPKKSMSPRVTPRTPSIPSISSTPATGRSPVTQTRPTQHSSLVHIQPLHSLATVQGVHAPSGVVFENGQWRKVADGDNKAGHEDEDPFADFSDDDEVSDGDDKSTIGIAATQSSITTIAPPPIASQQTEEDDLAVEFADSEFIIHNVSGIEENVGSKSFTGSMNSEVIFENGRWRPVVSSIYDIQLLRVTSLFCRIALTAMFLSPPYCMIDPLVYCVSGWHC